MSYNRYGSNFRKGVGKYRVAPKFEAEVIREYLAALDCPRSLACWLMFSYGEHDQLAEIKFDPLHYSSVPDVSGAYMATCFLSKFTGLTTSFDVKEVALKKFQNMELRCKQTNSRFDSLLSDQQFTGRFVWLHNAVIRKVERILGEFVPDEMFSFPDWGPGASTRIPRRRASSQEKFQCETGITRDLHALLFPRLFEMNYPHWAEHLKSIGFPQFEAGNKVITVAKDATTDRVIAIEPGINLWFQMALGRMIRDRLLGVGVDLSDQGKNQHLALLGSLNRELTTVDLSSASDTVSRSVVEALLPPRWFEVLNLCRSHYGRIADTLLKWEKFSSMGNGFTFQLESLVFYAIAKSCVEYLNIDGVVSVYGDDIVIPTMAYQLFTEVVEFYGFLVNRKKSHSDSYFRESCGAHFYLGFDVKPVFLKERISSLPSIYRTANKIRRLALRQGFSLGCDVRFRTLFDSLVQQVPKAFRLRIPDHLGDGGFISNFDEATPVRAKHGIEGYLVYHWRDQSKTLTDERYGYLLTELWRLSKRRAENPESRPSRLEATRNITALHREDPGRNSVPLHDVRGSVTKSLVRQWDDLGPWLNPWL